MAPDLRSTFLAGAIRMIRHGFGWRRSGARNSGNRVRAVLVVLLLPLGCAAPSERASREMSPEARRVMVADRVNARWAALIKGDIDAAYMFLSPASREVVSPAEFKARTRGSGFREVKVDSVECEPDVCKVRLFLTYDHRLMSGITTPLSESWVIDQGQFWYVWQQ
jgi:hypothetical protein